jgi:hypothetical protein
MKGVSMKFFSIGFIGNEEEEEVELKRRKEN